MLKAESNDSIITLFSGMLIYREVAWGTVPGLIITSSGSEQDK